MDAQHGHAAAASGRADPGSLDDMPLAQLVSRGGQPESEGSPDDGSTSGDDDAAATSKRRRLGLAAHTRPRRGAAIEGSKKVAKLFTASGRLASTPLHRPLSVGEALAAALSGDGSSEADSDQEDSDDEGEFFDADDGSSAASPSGGSSEEEYGSEDDDEEQGGQDGQEGGGGPVWAATADKLGSEAAELLKQVVAHFALTGCELPPARTCAVFLARHKERRAASAVAAGVARAAGGTAAMVASGRPACRTADKALAAASAAARTVEHTAAISKAKDGKAAYLKYVGGSGHQGGAPSKGSEKKFVAHVHKSVLRCFTAPGGPHSLGTREVATATCLPWGDVGKAMKHMADTLGGVLERDKRSSPHLFRLRPIKAGIGQKSAPKRQRGGAVLLPASTVASRVRAHLECIEKATANDRFGPARPFPHVKSATGAADIFAERGFCKADEALRGMQALELLKARRLTEVELVALKLQCKKEGTRCCEVSGVLTISIWLAIVWLLKMWEFRPLPLVLQDPQNFVAVTDRLSSIRNAQRGDTVILECAETGEKLAATIGRRVESRNTGIERLDRNAKQCDEASETEAASSADESTLLASPFEFK